MWCRCGSKSDYGTKLIIIMNRSDPWASTGHATPDEDEAPPATPANGVSTTRSTNICDIETAENIY
jgi:hypothetical protein